MAEVPDIFDQPGAGFVFMRPGIKFPPIEKGWQKKPHTFQEAKAHKGNVGVLAGNGYIGLDLDNPAAFEGLILPPTTSWETRPGRFGKWFRCACVPPELMAKYDKPANHSQFKLYKDGLVIGELKLERCYQVIPDSWKTLDDGQRVDYKLDDSMPPAIIDLATLIDGILALPGVSFVQNPKTDTATATCLINDLPPEDIERSIEPPDDRELAYARAALLKELATTETAPESTRYDQVYKSGCALGEFCAAGLLPFEATLNALIDAGEKSGLPRYKAKESARNGMNKTKNKPRKIPELTTLTPHIPPGYPGHIHEGWFDGQFYGRPKTKEEMLIKGMSQEEFDAYKLPTGPKFTLNLPADHFITRFIGYGSAISDAYRVYWFMAALFILAVVADKKIRFVTKMDTFYPNIWIYILGDSSLARKTTAVKKANEMLKAALGFMYANACVPNTFSPEAFIEHMSDYPHAPWVRDEAAGVLSVMQKEYMRGFKDDLMQLFDCTPINRMLRTSHRKGEKTRFNVDDPYLNLFFASTGAALGFNLNLIDKETGFLARFVFAYPQGEKECYMPLDQGGAYHSELEEICISQLTTLAAKMAELPECVDMTHSPEARAYYNTWQETREKEAARLKDGYSSQIFSRLNPTVIKLAMLFEMGSADFDPTRPIREEYFVEACRLIDEYFMPTTRTTYDLIGSANKENQIERILLYLSRNGGKATQKEIMRDVKIKSKDFAEYLLTMIECDLVEQKDVYDEETKRNTSYIFMQDNQKVAVVAKVERVAKVGKVEEIQPENQEGINDTVATLPTCATLPTLSTFHKPDVVGEDVDGGREEAAPSPAPTMSKKNQPTPIKDNPGFEAFKANVQTRSKNTCRLCGQHFEIPLQIGYHGGYICEPCRRDGPPAPAKTDS